MQTDRATDRRSSGSAAAIVRWGFVHSFRVYSIVGCGAILRRCAGSKTAQSSTQSCGTPTTPMERRSDTPTRCPSPLPEPSHARPACLARLARLHSSKIARFCAILYTIPWSFVAQGRVRRCGRLRSACKGAVPWLVVRHLLRMHAAVDPAAVRLIGNQVRSGPAERSVAPSRHGLVRATSAAARCGAAAFVCRMRGVACVMRWGTVSACGAHTRHAPQRIKSHERVRLRRALGSSSWPHAQGYY
jgi:hypothetical protein